APAALSQPLPFGEYRLELAADGFQPGSHRFTVGTYTASKADTPDMLPVALDRTDLHAGDTVQVKIGKSYAGRANVQVVGQGLLYSEAIEIRQGGVTVPIKVGSDWGTGAYVVVTEFRAMDAVAKRMPTRAIGLAWFGIDKDRRTLKLSLQAANAM